MITATIGHKKVSVSKHASLVLASLYELENAGLIENGCTELFVEPGYDAGSLETQAAPILTRHGNVFVQQMA